MSVVLDASCLIALLKGEPGAEGVAAALAGASLCTVNLAEALTWLRERGLGSAASALDAPLAVVVVHDFEAVDARASAELRPATRHRGLSLGDRACLALAQRLGLPALTTDRAWDGLEVGVEIRLLR